MSTSSSTPHTLLTVSQYRIELVYKPVKKMHLSVYPPDGFLRLSVPEGTPLERCRLFVIDKMHWLRQQIRQFQEQDRESLRLYVTGESHYYQGRRYLLDIVPHRQGSRLERTHKKLRLYTKLESSREHRERVVRAWYRQALKTQVAPLIIHWSAVLGVDVAQWGVRRMKTKWGACNTDQARIWVNLELAKKPYICLEYIVVHELIHLLERHHNEHFIALLDHHLPQWRLARDELNRLPVAHWDWTY